jgi:hypothetical protein
MIAIWETLKKWKKKKTVIRTTDFLTTIHTNDFFKILFFIRKFWKIIVFLKWEMCFSTKFCQICEIF